MWLSELRKYRSAFWKIACHYDIPLLTYSLTNPNLKCDRYITLYKQKVILIGQFYNLKDNSQTYYDECDFNMLFVNESKFFSI